MELLKRGLIIFSVLSVHYLNAQVLIPDENFASCIYDNGYAYFANGFIDTTSIDGLDNTVMDCSYYHIKDLTGIEYFRKLKFLRCVNNDLDSLPVLPCSLRYLEISYNPLTNLTSIPDSLSSLICIQTQLTTLPPLPNTLVHLDCSSNYLTVLPPLPGNLVKLICWRNSITSLPTLPATLSMLNCQANQLDSLPMLPINLDTIYCGGNYLHQFPNMPDSLKYLDCSYNLLDSLPPGKSLISLICDSNFLSFLPTFSPPLKYLSCMGNHQLTSLPNLPESLKTLFCAYDQLSVLPILPNSLRFLACSNNNITIVPILPDSLEYFACDYNQLSFLPNLPNSITTLSCNFNQLTSLPELPDSLFSFGCKFNPDLLCFPKLKRIVSMVFQNTGITCLPHYGNVSSSYPPLNTLPLCTTGNQNGCAVYDGIEEAENLRFSLFPNPASNLLNINYEGNTSVTEIVISSIDGKEMKREKPHFNSSTTEINIQNLSNGFYFLQLKSNERVVGVAKFVKE